MIEICMLASGSSGNAVYVATENAKILIDAGISGKRLAAALVEIGTESSALDALLLSHDHNDHAYGAGIMARRYCLPLYATAPTWDIAGKKLGPIPVEHRRILPSCGSVEFKDLLVETFPVPHDAACPVGFIFRNAKYSIALVTDLGCVTSYILERLQQLDCIVLEANHDEEMLKNGKYPWSLKKRILGDNGHLSNTHAAENLLKILAPKTKHVVLAHLSEENNYAALAHDTVCCRLEEGGYKPGKQVIVQVAERHTPSCHIRLV